MESLPKDYQRTLLSFLLEREKKQMNKKFNYNQKLENITISGLPNCKILEIRDVVTMTKLAITKSNLKVVHFSYIRFPNEIIESYLIFDEYGECVVLNLNNRFYRLVETPMAFVAEAESATKEAKTKLQNLLNRTQAIENNILKQIAEIEKTLNETKL